MSVRQRQRQTYVRVYVCLSFDERTIVYLVAIHDTIVNVRSALSAALTDRIESIRLYCNCNCNGRMNVARNYYPLLLEREASI